jgi:hypothetical protein
MPFSNALDCPRGMLPNQWLRIRRCFFQGREIFQITHVAQCDADIPQKPFSFDPFDGGTTKKQAKFFVAQFQVISQRHSDSRCSRGKRAFTGNLRETIPRAGVQAIVTAEDSITDKRPKFKRNGALVLYR